MATLNSFDSDYVEIVSEDRIERFQRSYSDGMFVYRTLLKRTETITEEVRTASSARLDNIPRDIDSIGRDLPSSYGEKRLQYIAVVYDHVEETGKAVAKWRSTDNNWTVVDKYRTGLTDSGG